jgi:hypothetical protein
MRFFSSIFWRPPRHNKHWRKATQTDIASLFRGGKGRGYIERNRKAPTAATAVRRQFQEPEGGRELPSSFSMPSSGLLTHMEMV